MSSSKVVSAGQGADAKQWLPPEMGERRERAGKKPVAPEVRSAANPLQTEDLQKQAYMDGLELGRQQGLEQGRQEGLKQAQAEVRRVVQQLDKLMALFSEPLRELDDQVEKELLELVLVVVRQLVRREVKSDPSMIIGVVREALSILPVASRNVRLFVHPDDAGLIRNIYTLGNSELGWSLVEDPVIERGGCRIVTDTSLVDATLESRLTSLIAPLLAGARSQDDAGANG